MESSGETSPEENSATNTKSDSIPDSTIRSASVSEVLTSDSESSDFDREYKCDVCDKYFSGLKSLKQHEKSKKHLKALRKEKLKGDLEDEDSPGEDFSFDRNQIYKKCEICDKEFNGPESYRLHIRSKHHKRKVANSKILEKTKVDGKVNVEALKQLIKMDSSAPAEESDSLEDDGTEDIFDCEDCDKVFNGLEPFREHISSKTHRKRGKQKKMIQSLASFDPENTIEIVDGDLTCKLCRMGFTGPESALSHLKSKGHSEWLEFKRWKKERKNSERSESELVPEACSSSEPTGNNSSGSSKKTFEIADCRETTEEKRANQTNENKNLAAEARISYKKYKEVINKSETIE